MTNNAEVHSLIARAVLRGASVTYSYDQDLLEREGRTVIDTVQVSGLAGVGPYPMPVLAAAEALRRVLGVTPGLCEIEARIARTTAARRRIGWFDHCGDSHDMRMCRARAWRIHQRTVGVRITLNEAMKG